MNQEGLYESVDCYGLRPFVCKAEFYDKTPEWDISALGAVVGCQEGWKLLGIHCYRYFDGKINFTGRPTIRTGISSYFTARFHTIKI